MEISLYCDQDIYMPVSGLNHNEMAICVL